MEKNSVIRLGVIGPGGAGRGNTLALVSSGQVELVAAADTNEQSLDYLENALRERVEGYKENSFNRYNFWFSSFSSWKLAVEEIFFK